MGRRIDGIIPYHRWVLQWFQGVYGARNIKHRKPKDFPLGAYNFELKDGRKFFAYFHHQKERVIIEQLNDNM